MSQPQPPPYTLNDVLLLLGQCTVELAWLRGKIAQLEAQLAAADGPNGVPDPLPTPAAHT